MVELLAGGDTSVRLKEKAKRQELQRVWVNNKNPLLCEGTKTLCEYTECRNTVEQEQAHLRLESIHPHSFEHDWFRN